MTLAICWHTWRECVRRPFPYLAVATILTISLASQLLHFFSFGAGAIEGANLAISALLLAGLAHTAFLGTGLVRADLERGTLPLLLSQPVGPAAYVLGRFLGLLASTLLVCGLTAAGITAILLLSDAPPGLFRAPLLLGWARGLLAAGLLSAAALAASAIASRLFAPVLLLALFAWGDIAGASLPGRLLPSFSLFGLDAASSAPTAILALYAALYSVVFLGITYLRLIVRAPIRTES
jgi:ABC-type transport system involved in multi-copper enzyme maturation permease subunit